MSLTPEERRRIYEEEKARLEAQRQLQAQQPSPSKKKGSNFLVGCLVVVGGLILLGIIGSQSGKHTESPAPGSVATQQSASKERGLVLVDSKPVSEEYSRYIVGTVKNNTSRTYGYVQVEINLYDDAGNQVGSTLANTNNLGPGSAWKFKALILENNATHYQVVRVAGF